MRQELDKLIAEYTLELKRCGESQTLEQLQEAYTNTSSMRDEIYDYIHAMHAESADADAEIEGELSDLLRLETALSAAFPFPIFDETLDEISLFEDYPTYFQRYGCMDVDYILSWDDSNILFHDVDSDLIEIIQRPDVLMRGL